ncbi:hypothetical protein HBI81_147760 [Parastagonospora nodorum]|nr:hypothetical protein HBH49_221820 [Parastagonospora nodorum]KAH4116937.1 hypothetical protein HBH47_160300 [Parastagonospora nodorum]KAH5085279.1 hypothetical protein HBH95_029650 [Parastagonospora nodorum]KAH5257556.1 hypothetical protein HBI72_125960 [Parastagonospora nodorum]KAH6437243.1 hypothetical protein HBI59_161960 [Parastagonospora nodorum]
MPFVVCSQRLFAEKGVAERLERKGKNGTVVRPYSPTAEEHGPNGLAVRFLDGSCVFEAPLTSGVIYQTATAFVANVVKRKHHEHASPICTSVGIPRYAILPHRWRDEEVLFADPNGNITVAQAKKDNVLVAFLLEQAKKTYRILDGSSKYPATTVQETTSKPLIESLFGVQMHRFMHSRP